MSPEEEQHLLKQCQLNPAAFASFFDEYYSPVFAYIYRCTVDYDLSRDIAAETFLKAFLNISNFKWTGVRVSSWIYRIAGNELSSYYRKQKYTPQSLQQLIEEYGEDYLGLLKNEDQEKLKLTILNASRSASIGIWLIVVPCYFLFCIFMKYYFHYDIGLISIIEEMMASLDKDPLMKWFSPMLLVGFPLMGIILNFLAITHFSYDKLKKELRTTVRIRWANIILLFISLGIVTVFLLYAITENIHHN